MSHSSKIRIRRGPIHITRIGENVSSAPQQLHPCRLLTHLGFFNHHGETRLDFKHRPIAHHIGVVETIEWGANLADKLESRIHACQVAIHHILVFVPGEHLGARPEGITPRATQRMPVSDCKAQVFPHRNAINFLRGVIPLERQGILGLSPFVLNFADTGKKLLITFIVFHHDPFWLFPMQFLMFRY